MPAAMQAPDKDAEQDETGAAAAGRPIGAARLARGDVLLQECLAATALIYGIAMLIGVPFIFVRKVEAAVIILLVLLAIFCAWRMMQRGHTAAAGRVYVGALWVVATLVVVGAPPGLGAVMYTAPVFGAAVLLGATWGSAVAFLSIAVSAFTVLGRAFGIELPALFPAPPVSQLFCFVTQLAVAIVPVYRVMRRLECALQTSAAELAERERVEQALRASEQAFARVFRASPMAIVIGTVEEGRYLDVNDEFERLMGYSRAELIGRTSRELCQWVNAADRAVLFKQAREPGGRTGIEACLRRRNGDIIVCELWADIIEFSGQTCMLAVVNDITGRKRAESALEQTFRRTAGSTGTEFMRRLVLELATALDVKYCFVSELLPVNPERARTLAFCAGGMIVDNIEYELAGTPCANVIKQSVCHIPADLQQWFPEDRALAEMQAQSYLGTPVFSNDGTLLGLVSVLDVKPMESSTLAKLLLGTFAARAAAELERMRFESRMFELNHELERRVGLRTAELESSNRQLEAFSYSVSHDLRAPLHSISGFSNLLLQDYRELLGDEGRRFLERIVVTSKRMTGMINDMLELARLSRRALQLRNADLGEIAGDVLRDLAEVHPDRAVETRVARGVAAYVDPGLMRIALENLLGNAWKFTARSASPRIEFGVLTEAGEPIYFVRDNGAGFDMRYAGKLFQEFQRLHSLKEFDGIGIGLATVRRIIERHRGRIWAESEPGQGATFFFTLGGGPAGAGMPLSGLGGPAES
jgi:PAS domain S-box-containing protein